MPAAWITGLCAAWLSAFAASPALGNTCSAATAQGTAPSDYQDYCWLDFTGYSDTLARGAGQNFSYSLPDGSTLSLTLKVSSSTTGAAIVPVAVPSWSGAAIGNTAFIGIAGKPVLYEGTTGTTVQLTLSNIAIAPPPGSNATSVYSIVAADGESTNGGETLSFTTNGTAWTELAAIANGTVFPSLSGVGTNTVTETGANGTVGAYAFSSLGNPTQVSSTLVGSGLQGAIFALRYASISLSAQLSGARANASDQFTYTLATTGGTTLASGTSTGAASGPFPAASLPLLAATYPFVVSETMAAGSPSTLASYGVSLTCTNHATGSSTSLPTGLATNRYTFPALNYGDSLACVFTDTANRANLGVAKTGPATVPGGSTLNYSLAVSNQGPSDASGSVLKDPAVANFTATAVSCTAAGGGAVCPAAAATTVANLQGSGIPMPTLPSGGTLSFTVTGTAGAANITNTAAVATPGTVVNSNATPTSSVTTTVSAAADAATSMAFPATVNAGQTVTGTVLYTNNGPSIANGVTYGLTLPANLTPAPTLTGLPVGATYSYAAATGIVTFTGMPGTLASAASAGPITVSYLQPASGSSVVTGSIATTTTDPNLANNTANLTIGGNPEADLGTALTFPASVNAGATVTGTVLYTNNGPSTAAAVAYTLTLPANLAPAPVLSGLPTGAAYAYTAGTGVVSFTGLPATLASGAAVGPITVSYKQPGAGTSSVSGSVDATTNDPNPANNAASTTIGGSAEADVATSLTFPASVNAGGMVTGTVVYTDNGPSMASGLSFALTLPANLSAVPALSGLPTGAAYSYTASTGVVTLTGMPVALAAGAGVGPITVSYVQPGAATSTVTSAITTSTNDPSPADNNASVTIAGVAEADLATTLSFPASVNAGAAVTGTVLYTNNGPSVASGAAYSLTLPANLAVPPTLANLPAGATYGYAAATGVVTVIGLPPTLAAGAAAGPITVSYVQPGTATSTVSAGVAATTNDPNPANNAASATIGGAAEADLATSLSLPASVNAGQTVTGTVLYKNNGPSAAAQVAYTLTLPATLSAAPTLSGLPTGAGYSYATGTGVVTLTGMPASLAAGGSPGTITISYTQPATATSTVTAGISATTADPSAANNAASATIGGAAQADLATVLSFPASVNAGLTVTGTVLYANNGPSPAAQVAYTLTLPANLSAAPTLSGLPTGATYAYSPSTGSVTLSGMPATLAAAAAAATVGPITVSFVQPGIASSTVTATVTANTADPNPANNTASVTTGGVAEADLATTLHFPGSVNAGSPVSGTILFANDGPSVATGVSYSLTLPANLAVPPTLSGLPAGAAYAYAPGTGVVTLTAMPATLAAAAALSPITVAYTQPASGNSVVTAGIAAPLADPNPGNNDATATIAGSALADVAATLNFPTDVDAGQTVTGTVTFTNKGPSPAAGVTFVVTLPTNLGRPPQPTLPAGVSYVYTPSTGVVTLNGTPTTLAAGASFGPLTISYIQPGSAASRVGVAIASTTTDPDPANNAASATITGAAEADLATLLHFPANANAGQTVSGTLTYTNHGPSLAAGLTVSLTLPANLTTPPTLTGLPAGAAYTYAANTGIVSFTGLTPTLAAAATIGPVTVTYLQPGGGNSAIAAGLSATTSDPIPGNNAASATITGIPLADVGATLSFPAHANAGQPIAGTLQFANHGPSAAAAVTYTLTLPANLDAPPAIGGLPPGAAATYDAASGVETLSGLPTTLTAGTAIGPIAVSYRQPASGTSTVSAGIATTTTDPAPANNAVSASITGAAAQVQGTVYLDNNQDAGFDAGDSPLAGATVSLLSGARVVATTSTDATGYYSFTAAPTGSYNVAVTLAQGFLATTPASVAIAFMGGAPLTVNFGEIATTAVGDLVVTKSTPLVNISAGQSVPYTITATNPKNTPVDAATMADVMPAGFRYRPGSGAINGKKQDPTVAGHTLTWTHLRVPAGGTLRFTLVLTAGAGVGGGEYVNQAMAYNGLTNTLISNIASATVRITGDPTFDCPDLIGKVFDDANANGREDPGEKGIAGVRLVTAQGLLVTTDAEGRYHIACPIQPDAEIGTNFIVKLDERTLPSGYRLTTDNPETVRLTAGKVSKLNFGATIHHVVRIELDADAFAGNGALTDEAKQRIAAALALLRGRAGIVRLAYRAADEPDATVAARLASAHRELEALWMPGGAKDALHLEEEVVRRARARPDAGGTPP